MPKLLSGCIYGLRDPRDYLYRYVGQTTNENRRKYQHLHGCGIRHNRNKEEWEYTLMQLGLKPEFVVLERIESDYPIVPILLSRESFWCDKLINEGHPLTNKPAGRVTKCNLISKDEIVLLMEMVSDLRENWMALISEVTARIDKKYIVGNIYKIERDMLRVKHRLEDALFSKGDGNA